MIGRWEVWFLYPNDADVVDGITANTGAAAVRVAQLCPRPRLMQTPLDIRAVPVPLRFAPPA